MELEVINAKTNEAKVQKIYIQYDVLPKYCHTCKLQGHDESEYRTLHLELRPKREENEQEEIDKNTMEGEIGIQRRYQNGKVVFAKWNPTSRRFKVEQGTTKLIKENDGMLQGQSKINSNNPFVVLQSILPEEETTKEKDLVMPSQGTKLQKENDIPIEQDTTSGSAVRSKETGTLIKHQIYQFQVSIQTSQRSRQQQMHLVE